ncbi:valine--tRNA ligase [Mangrovactinospora gilvigrisea]|uniref:Valine--tRNA ligase n=1 Tax=Mangrovactinospora gilvigrisea TaxID=1428644 RepID=A0A1J7BB54_9ACTN|nr:valine--tRNA ligase [Mangrovactinospora gilvigrisea]OIV35919.1 valine--tRNA ligase [Mangrovactinospora gilvigrisea]
MANTTRPQTQAPGRPSLDSLAAVWSRRWDAEQVYAFDRSAPRSDVYAIDTPPLTASGAMHIGHAFSYTHADVIARYRRMRGNAVFYPMGWDDNGLPTERRVQIRYGVRCDPSLPYDPDFTPPAEAPAGSNDPARQLPVSRRNFIELCRRATEEDEEAFEELWRRLGLSVDWSLAYRTIDDNSRAASQRAFLRALARGEAYTADAPTLWDVTFRTAVAQAELEDRERPGAFHDLRFTTPDGATDAVIATTRPELLPACVAVVAHPSDERYAALIGGTLRTPLFGVEVPVLAHRLADPEKGTGLAMVCTFGDTTDIVWWRELDLPTRSVLGFDGRLLAEPPAALESDAAREAYARLAGATPHTARERIVAMLRESGELLGEPRRISHPVKFYENGSKPLEIVTTRQWYLRNGGRDPELRERLLARGRELAWHPPHMRTRYENWVEGLAGDWLISRQRYFGVPLPVWYPLDAEGEPVHEKAIAPDEAALPIDPATDTPPGYTEAQRDVPGGFTAETDIMDTWATSSLTPQIAGGWERDPELFAKVFPMHLRPQAHEIIRTWLFSTVLRADRENGSLPFSDAMISGWILDPDRKKMSKSKGKPLTPVDLLEEFGSDAVRYWAAAARPGTDTAFDTGQMRVGRRLATKVLNAARFVIGVVGEEPGGREAVTEVLDRAMLAELDAVAAEAARALDGLDHARALEAVERVFWTFCDDYLELVKARAYGDTGAPAASASARAALSVALSALLRMLAPVLPFATEQAWHERYGEDAPSIHGEAWPQGAAAAPDGAADALRVASELIAAVRRAKSEAKASMRAEVVGLAVRGPAVVRDVLPDVVAAGHVTGPVEIGEDEALEVAVRL